VEGLLKYIQVLNQEVTAKKCLNSLKMDDMFIQLLNQLYHIHKWTTGSY